MERVKVWDGFYYCYADSIDWENNVVSFTDPTEPRCRVTHVIDQVEIARPLPFRDKDGFQVFEGDIVVDKFGNNRAVVLRDDGGEMECRNESGLVFEWLVPFKIIGNKWEDQL